MYTYGEPTKKEIEDMKAMILKTTMKKIEDTKIKRNRKILKGILTKKGATQ